MSSTLADISSELEAIRAQSLWKVERPILGHQSAHIAVKSGEVLNFCANNYLGLADHPDLVKAAKEALETHGLGMASPIIWARTMLSCSPPASTPMARCSSPCSASRMRSSLTP